MSEEITKIFDSYSLIIQSLIDEVCEMELKTVLLSKKDKINSYRDTFSEISLLLVAHTKTFITDINKADAYLYPRKDFNK